jgi:hypothetical protein
VDDLPVYERLRQARIDRGEDAATISRRIGVGERLVLAIDEGRFGDLPGGIYARTAIRLYARGVGLEPGEVLTACDPFLPCEEDPVSALARLRGIKPARLPTPRPAARQNLAPAATLETIPEPSPFPAWRPLAAVALDGFVVATLLLVAVAGTISMSGTGASFSSAAAPVFGVLGLLLGSCYFLFFGGIACATAGERLIGMRVGRRSPRHVDPRTVAARAVRCAGRDVRYLVRLGAWAGTVLPSGSARGESGQTPSIGHAAGQ